MDRIGFLFPGQGSQKQGMGKEFYETYETAREIFNRAEKILTDCSIKSLCFEADDEELRRTENTQPALFASSYSIFSVLKEKGYTGDVFAGHSLGEYTAITASGYISFEDGLKLVRRRGILMRDCDPGQKGGMAAIIGLDNETVGTVCRETGDVFSANFNSPNQIVISGMKDRLKIAVKKLEAAGARRAIMLNVGGPFHTPYMKEAAHEMEKELDSIEWKRGKGSIVSNATAEVTGDPVTIKKNLINQLYHPVLWNVSCQKLVDLGYSSYIEPGPGGVLKGLFRTISREVKVFPVEKPDDVDRIE